MTKHTILFIGLLAFLCFASFKLPYERKLPSIEVRNLNGSSVNLSTITNNGKPMIIFAWEVTCKPCIAEFDAIAKKYKKWKDETGVKVVAVSVDEARNTSLVRTQCISKGWEYEVYLDPNQSFKRAMGVQFCPYVLIANNDGNIVWQKGGYSPGDENIIYEVVQKIAKGEKVD